MGDQTSCEMSTAEQRKQRSLQNMIPGIYRVSWAEECGGGFSYAAIGQKSNGEFWIACTNWLGEGELKDYLNPDSIFSNKIQRLVCVK